MGYSGLDYMTEGAPAAVYDQTWDRMTEAEREYYWPDTKGLGGAGYYRTLVEGPSRWGDLREFLGFKRTTYQGSLHESILFARHEPLMGDGFYDFILYTARYADATIKVRIFLEGQSYHGYVSMSTKNDFLARLLRWRRLSLPLLHILDRGLNGGLGDLAAESEVMRLLMDAKGVRIRDMQALMPEEKYLPMARFELPPIDD